MAAIGKDTLSSVVRHYILPQVTDVVYTKNNALLYRLIRGNKRMVQGGNQIEVPLMYKRFTGGGGAYRGFDILDVTPQDTIKNAYLDWKQHYAGIAIDGLTLIKSDSPLAIANVVKLQGQQMYMEMGENLAAGIYSDGVTDPKDIDGMGAILSVTNTYGGISRVGNPWWQATIDAATATLSFTALRGVFGNATFGATHPTIAFGNGTNYNRLYALGLTTPGYNVTWNREPGGYDETLMQAGFTNLMWENIPFVRDDNCPSTRVMLLNENFIELVVSPRADFFLNDFEKPVDQDAYISTLVWAGNLMCTNPRTQAALTNLSA